MSFVKPFTLDFGPTGDTYPQGADKLEDNVDDIYTNLNTLLDGSSISKVHVSQGIMLNGVITPTIVSNKLVVAIKTAAGGNPSTADPVYANIAGTIRTLTAALSITLEKNSAFGAGEVDLATKEVDLFVYLGWKASDTSIIIGLSRRPDGYIFSDFSASGTDATYVAVSATPAAGDFLENVGRVSTKNSGTANYNWSAPTAHYYIHRPIRTTSFPPGRGDLVWVPTIGTDNFVSAPDVDAHYSITDRHCKISIYITGTSHGTDGDHFTFTLPFKAKYASRFSAHIMDDDVYEDGYIGLTANSVTATVFKNAIGTGFAKEGVKALNYIEFEYLIV